MSKTSLMKIIVPLILQKLTLHLVNTMNLCGKNKFNINTKKICVTRGQKLNVQSIPNSIKAGRLTQT